MWNRNFKVGQFLFGTRPFFIADIAANHDGDLSRAIDLIGLAAEAGADAVKFQHFQASTIVHDAQFRKISNGSHQTKWNKSVFEVYEDASLPLDWNEKLASEAKIHGIEYFTTPYNYDAVDVCRDWVTAYKIGSGDVTWTDFIEKICSKGLPVFLATGAATFDQVQSAVNLVEASGNNNFCLMQCNTNYTGSKDNIRHVNLRVLETFNRAFPGLPLGLSDHTPGHVTVLGAIALGAMAIEKHFTDDNSREGPDHAFSMDPESWGEMVARSIELFESLGDGLKIVESNELEARVVQQRAMYITQDVVEGDCLADVGIEVLRPCPNDAFELVPVASRMRYRFACDMTCGSLISAGDLSLV